MNRSLFHRAMSYVDDDIVETFFENKSKREMIALPLHKSRAVLKWGAVAAVFCLIVASSFVMLLNFPDSHTTPTVPATSSSTTASSDSVTPESTVTPSSTEPTFTLPAPIENIVWYDKSNSTQSSSTTIWNGMTVSADLQKTLNTIENDRYMALVIRFSDKAGYLKSFVYDGRNYDKCQKELDSLLDLYSRYVTLYRFGEELKYGELLYTEGLPDGTKWTKELYDETVESCTEEVISKFIVDGVFLSEDLENALEKNQIEIWEKKKTIDDLIEAYHQSASLMIAEAFSQYAVILKNSSVYLFITPAELKMLQVDNIEDYSFRLAPLDSYEGKTDSAEIPDVPVLENTVSGFDYSKISFDSLLNTENRKPTSDEDVINMLNETMELWKYSYDQLEFTFYYDDAFVAGLTSWEEFDRLNYDYETMHHCDIALTLNPLIMTVRVEYKNINPEALKELSLKAEITKILITIPISSVFDPE